MASEIWSLNEKIGVAKEGPRMPEVGDVLELDHGGEVAPWEVEKIHHYFPLDGRPVRRILVKYAGSGAARAQENEEWMQSFSTEPSSSKVV